MMAKDTIFALSSGPGRAAIAIIRISGPGTAGILQAVAGRLPPPREAALRALSDPATGEVVDRAIVLWLPGPASFTGEDCAELHLHGSQAVVSVVAAILGRQPETRPAEAGEFTRRAFSNGKMDLVEIEGLADLLEARTSVQRRQALRQMSGRASSVFEFWRNQLLLIRADIEAAVDFADEPGVAEAAMPGIDARIKALLAEMGQAVERSSSAEIIREGVKVVLAGHPNTGKSSLLNALAQRDAAIVSSVPGTTRDAIEVTLDLSGIPLILTDTAGLRDVTDVVEAEGIRRSRRHMAAADVLVWVWSADIPGSETQDPDLQADLVVMNKCDRSSGLLRNDMMKSSLMLSAQSGEGIPSLLQRLGELVRSRYGSGESSLIVSQRQKSVTLSSIRLLNDAMEPGQDRLEIKAEAIRRASEEIGRLTGRIGVEEWLGVIFSRFCIGK